MNNPNYYAIIPAIIRYDETLQPNAKLLYGEITALCNTNGFCWAENEYFATLYQCSNETVSRWISALKNKGFIRVEIDRKKGNSRRIYLLTKMSRPIDENINTLLTKKSRPIDENVNSYIRNNNTINTTRENSARAYDYLISECKGRLEQEFEIKYKSQIKDFDKFKQDFDDTVDTENLNYFPKILLARLCKYARNWIQNQGKYNNNQATNNKPLNSMD